MSISWRRAMRAGPIFTSPRRDVLLSWCKSLGPKPVGSGSLVRTYRPMLGQWRVEDAEGFGRVFEAELIGSDKFPRPSSVQWTKELANKVHLIGNVGRDMEIKYLESGKVLATCSLAVSRPSKNEETSWFEMEFWDSLAEIAGHHLKKGDRVYVTGRLVIDTRLKNGVNQKSVRLVASDVNYVEDEQPVTKTDTQGVRRGTSSSWTQSQWMQSQSPQTSGGKGNASKTIETEKLWNEYFSDPTKWWDNRANKPSPKSPDFKHKSTKEALWVISSKTPSWVPKQLEKLEAARQEHYANGGGMHSQNNRSSSFTQAEFK